MPAPSKGKALIAMSGGVDSSVAAALTQQAGLQCLGATMQLLPGSIQGGCCSLEDVEDARSVARRLGIPFYVFNYTRAFRSQVMEPFATAYLRGETPNPCIWCNQHLKFTLLLRRALELGCRWLVTGHYARIQQQGQRMQLLAARDATKDQSYFLCHMTQQQLAHSRFPLGEMEKSETRSLAEALGLVTAHKRDSQDICFLPQGDYPKFLENFTGQGLQPGDFLDLSGRVLGQHRGAAAYTLGQRRGLGLAAGQRLYVCSKSMAKNTVTLGPEAALYRRALWAGSLNWIAFEALTAPMAMEVKTRSRQRPQPAMVYPEQADRVHVLFQEPQRAPTPGQTIAFYDGATVLGGGIIA